MKSVRTLREMFSLKGFVARSELQGKFGDPKARIIELRRQKKRRLVLNVEQVIEAITIESFPACAVVMRWVIAFIFTMNGDVSIARIVVVFTWNV